MARPRRWLPELARRVGILESYRDGQGCVHRASERTTVALLGALGFDGSTERAARAALEVMTAEERARVLDAVRVAIRGEPGARRVTIHVRPAFGDRVRVRLDLIEEMGRAHTIERKVPVRRGVAAVTLPPSLPDGYHRIEVHLRTGTHTARGRQRFILCPRLCVAPEETLAGDRSLGILTHLYTVRSARDWGVGDLTDLRRLARWAAREGAAFVGLNPLHALFNEKERVSPYAPASRLFRNPLYLDVETVPELKHSAPARRLLASRTLTAAREKVRASACVEYEAVMALKRPVLEALHRTFRRIHRGRDTARGRAYARFVERGGEPLRDFATFMALRQHLAGCSSCNTDWRRWPVSYRGPLSPHVEEFRKRYERDVDFQCYLQFELDRQLAVAAHRSGLSLGLYMDLAAGTAPDGADPWAFPELFVEGARLGAPPDPFATGGQNWGVPPLHPIRLHEDGYRYWALALRAGMAHAGALRVDHAIGLVRQYWIPKGSSASDGAFVRFPARELLAVAALESRRSGAVIVAEDLGTVPPELPRALARHGVLSNRVFLFERTPSGGFRPSRSYPRRALAVATTHDLPTLAAFWEGRDLELRRRLGLIPDAAALETAKRRRAKDRRAILRRLATEGLLPSSRDPGWGLRLRDAIHAFLVRTPCAMVGVNLDDLAGEVDPLNVPGTTPRKYPNWTRRMSVRLEDLVVPVLRRR